MRIFETFQPTFGESRESNPIHAWKHMWCSGGESDESSPGQLDALSMALPMNYQICTGRQHLERENSEAHLHDSDFVVYRSDVDFQDLHYCDKSVGA